MRSALSERLREGNFIVVDEISVDKPKTKAFIGLMTALQLADNKKETKTLFVDSVDNADLILSSRNVKNAKIVNSYGVNIYDLIYHEKIVISKAAVEELNSLLNPQREKRKAVKEAA